MRSVTLLCILFWGEVLFAAGTRCLVGSPKNQTFTKAIQNSTTPLMTQFRGVSAFKSQEGQLNGCLNGLCSEYTSELYRLPRNLNEIPKECIVTSMKRKVAQTSIECRRQSDGNWNFVRHSARSKNRPCMDSSTADYVHFVTNKVLSCFQGLSLKNGVKASVDVKMFYAKINNESAFNFSYSYRGGTGIGQLTSSAVREMNVINSKGTPGRGRFILDAILNSTKPECQDLRHVIADDMRFRYQKPRETIRTCEWVSMETGLARGLIYSLGFFSFLKNEIIGKQLRRIAPHAYNDPDILNLLTMVGYGPNGANRALELIYELKMHVRATSLDYVKNQLRKEKYVKATMNKLAELKQTSGDSCRLL
ncbi:MAG: hypothetical protein JNL11_09360 [Bdellovibrionaceae bacterium]|nr:hypothetical protein [Pseudobdellovibrionaceae bacterium]